MSFQEIFSGEIITSNTKRQATPDYSKENPLKVDVFVNGIELILNTEFSKKGAVIVLIDGHTKFNSLSTSFEGYSKFPIPLEQKIARDVKIEIFAWNKIDTNQIKCSVNLSMSKNPQPFNSQATPLTKDDYNKIISTTEELFALDSYLDETLTKLIDMEGYRKLIVLFEASTIIPPVEITAPSQNTYTVGTNSYPNQGQDSGTASSIENTSFDDNETTRIYDLITETVKNIVIARTEPSTSAIFDVTSWVQSMGSDDCAKTQHTIDALFSRTWTVDESNDPTFATGVTNIFTDVSPSSLDNIPTTKRYLRLIEKIDVGFDYATAGAGNQNDCGSICPNPFCCILGCGGMTNTARNIINTTFTSVTDSLTTGGQAELSFEIKSQNDGSWNEYIAASEFGTITAGEKVTKQVGDNDTTSQSGLTYTLPSTQTDFRAKLIITNGINTGVSVIKVA